MSIYNILNTAQNECIIDNLGRSPCQNHGVCIDHINNYTCHCNGSYTGINCSEEGKDRIPLNKCIH